MLHVLLHHLVTFILELDNARMYFSAFTSNINKIAKRHVYLKYISFCTGLKFEYEIITNKLPHLK